MSSSLIAIASEIGAPMVKRILQHQIGGIGGQLAGEVIDKIAAQAGGTREDIDRLVIDRPQNIREAVAEVERQSPELIALYAAGLEGQFAALKAETEHEHFISWAWRPMGMWGLGFLWFWNVLILHVANAYWKIALPQMDLDVLLQLTVVYCGLYMGGHTVKDFIQHKWGPAA